MGELSPNPQSRALYAANYAPLFTPQPRMQQIVVAERMFQRLAPQGTERECVRGSVGRSPDGEVVTSPYAKRYPLGRTNY